LIFDRKFSGHLVSLEMSFKCKLCNQEKPLIKAHLFPKKYFVELRRGSSKKHMVEITVAEGLNERFSQSGVYDTSILCGDCDNLKLGVYDSYSYALFPPELDETKIQKVEPKIEQYPLEKVDAGKLKRFLIALLWRLHTTQNALGEHVDLGPGYSALFKETLLGKSDEALKHIGCSAFLLLHPQYPRLMLSPFRNKFGGVNCYQVYFPPWKLVVRLDKRPFESPFQEVELKDGRAGVALVQRNWSQGELRLLQNLQRRVRFHKGLQP
jgi:hypothetical protein